MSGRKGGNHNRRNSGNVGSGKGKSGSGKANMWSFLTRALEKGALLPSFLGIWITLFIARLSDEKLAELVDEVLLLSTRWYYLGYFFNFVLAYMWYRSSKRLRRINAQELKRLADEKSKWQALATDRKLSTSNK